MKHMQARSAERRNARQLIWHAAPNFLRLANIQSSIVIDFEHNHFSKFSADVFVCYAKPAPNDVVPS